LVGIPFALGRFIHIPNYFEEWLEPVFAMGEHAGGEVHHEVHAVEYLLMAMSVMIALAAIYVAIFMYLKRKELPAKFVARFPRLYKLVYHKYYVDEIYQKVFVGGLLAKCNFWALFDGQVIDGFVNFTAKAVRMLSKVTGFFDGAFVDGLVNLTGTAVSFTGAQLRRFQTGRVQNYLYVAMAGVLVMMIWKLW